VVETVLAEGPFLTLEALEEVCRSRGGEEGWGFHIVKALALAVGLLLKGSEAFLVWDLDNGLVRACGPQRLPQVAIEVLQVVLTQANIESLITQAIESES
jgi:hypothetical protein